MYIAITKTGTRKLGWKSLSAEFFRPTSVFSHRHSPLSSTLAFKTNSSVSQMKRQFKPSVLCNEIQHEWLLLRTASQLQSCHQQQNCFWLGNIRIAASFVNKVQLKFTKPTFLFVVTNKGRSRVTPSLSWSLLAGKDDTSSYNYSTVAYTRLSKEMPNPKYPPAAPRASLQRLLQVLEAAELYQWLKRIISPLQRREAACSERII